MRLVSSTFPTSFSACWFLMVFAFLLLYHSCLSDYKNSTSDDHILCIERERVALVEFKHHLVDPDNRLVSWGSTDEDDCCNWSGIVCDIITGHVIQIHLRGPDDPLQTFSMLSGHKISPSLLSLEKLEYLDISHNNFNGMQIPKFIGSLQNLRYLNLSFSDFSGEIPPQLGNLSALNTIDLSFNPLSSDNLRWLTRLSMLHYLDISEVDLSKASNWLHTINSLPSLVELRMLSCCLRNSSPYPVIISNNSSSLFFLDLSDNPDLTSGIVFHNITSLRELDVSYNPFMNMTTVLTSLSTSVGRQLTTLGLSACDMSSSSIEHLRNMTSIVVLDLSYNQLTKKIPKSLGNLCNLRDLDLSMNNFSHETGLLEILKTIFECDSSKLEFLEIKGSNVSGHLPEQIGRFHNLVHLDLSYNLLSGPIPYSIGSLSSLRSLGISSNQLNGSLTPTIGQLCELEDLRLSYNMFSGMVTEDHVANLTKLKKLDAGGNSLILKLQPENWEPPFQLVLLGLNSWNLGTQFPLWLRSQTHLQELDLSNTGISDIIPNWFWTRFSNLSYLDVSSNQIQGTISMIPPNVYFFDLSCNNFSGPLPKVSTNSMIIDLDLSSNSFAGSLKPLLCGTMAPLLSDSYLNVSNNNLSGVIPQCWKDRKGLRMLDLENNRLSGEIPTSLGYLTELQYLNLRNNKLVGKLPVSFMNLTSLKILQLSKNNLMGNIPSWLGSRLSELRILELRSNRFSGDVSLELCRLVSLQILDLAYNNLTGDIPTCFNNFSGMSSIEDVSSDIRVDRATGSATVAMRGREDQYSSTLGLVTMLDLSNNHFSGSIPNELMSLEGLRSMSLSRNHLTGRIPDKIGDMKQIEYLDLCHNQLQGEIPVSLSYLNFLHTLDLSYNNLTGRIPTSTQIQGLDKSSFIGNRLCGPPLTRNCVVGTLDHNGPGSKVGSNTAHEYDWGFIMSILLGFAIGFWVVLGPLILNKSWRITYFPILYKFLFKIYDVIF